MVGGIRTLMKSSPSCCCSVKRYRYVTLHNRRAVTKRYISAHISSTTCFQNFRLRYHWIKANIQYWNMDINFACTILYVSGLPRSKRPAVRVSQINTLSSPGIAKRLTYIRANVDLIDKHRQESSLHFFVLKCPIHTRGYNAVIEDLKYLQNSYRELNLILWLIFLFSRRQFTPKSSC